MNILFLTMIKISSIEERSIYTDLLRVFVRKGHKVYIVTPIERREKRSSDTICEENVTILPVRTLNLQKTSKVEKGIGQILLEYQYLKRIKKDLADVTFDLILYSTPPITFTKVISYVKQRDKAYSYLLLKDIFPQNAVDMKMLSEGGRLHNFFLKKENLMYELSDTIGCMSQANIEFMEKHHPNLKLKLEINPNSIEPITFNIDKEELINIRVKYGLPTNKKIFIYGGNLGKPQGVDFLLETIEKTSDLEGHFLVVGTGTEFARIEKWLKINEPQNATLLEGLPKQDYDKLLYSCDVGLIFLHKDFSIPNFPSRLLSYLEMKKPVIAATDSISDVGEVIEKAKCGKWVLSGDIDNMRRAIGSMLEDSDSFELMKENAIRLLYDEYLVDKSYTQIIKALVNV